jgi:putative sterol carrier protein
VPKIAATEEFFDQLARRGHEELLQRASGTLRFDLKHGAETDHWAVAVDRGDVAVSKRNVKADCVIRADSDLFEGVASGRVNVVAAYLRGVLAIEGDPELAVLFQRLFPGPPRSRAAKRNDRRGGDRS